MQIFARITKIDAATRRVTGILAQEMVDRSGEIFDYDASKAHFQSWSEGIAKATDGKSVGNMRSMHSNLVAGKFVDIQFNDVAKSIEVVGEVVDDAEWKKCESGCYTGFSIGGRYARKWNDPADPTKKRYEAVPSEGSLVDMPCIPTAQFKMVKADGVEELHKFHVEDVSPVVKVLLVDNALAKALPALGVLCTLLGVGPITKYDEANLSDLLGKASAWDGALAATVKVLDEGIREIAAEFADPEALERAAQDELHKSTAAALEVAKGVNLDLLAKVAKAEGDLNTANESLQKVTGERDTALAKVTSLDAEVADLKKKVVTPRGIVRPMAKADDGNPLTNKTVPEAVEPIKKADGSIDHLATADAEVRKALGFGAKK